MKTLKLFNAVVKEETTKKKPFVSEDGYVIEPGALWARDRIVEYYQKQALNGDALNKTFHKSWAKIKNSDQADLVIEQILHYLTTYGTDFQAEAYIPDEVLKVPGVKIAFKVIKAYTRQQMIDKALGLLKSGIALKEETVDDIISVLADDLKYQFTGSEGIRNKEAVVKIADLFGVIPTDFPSFFRYIIFRATNSTLVIKNPKTIEAIKASTYNPVLQFEKFGLDKLAENFNRFKPLFLAFKSKCPKTINRIAKLSKTFHKPLVANPLNLVTQRKLTEADNHWLDNATPYALFKALTACYQRYMREQDTFVYKIRNGKSYVKTDVKTKVLTGSNYLYLLRYLKTRFSLKGKKIFIPQDVVYAVPTSEKMFVGNIPTGTKFYGDRLAVGIYWENAWGARDLDLSGTSVDGKVGWDRNFRSEDGELMFSGDITNAPNGAVEYLYAKKNTTLGPTLINVNVFARVGESWGDDAELDASKPVGYKIIVGRGDKINYKYMMNPNNLFMEAKVEAVQKQMITGMFLTEDGKQAFVLLNLGSGHARSAGYDQHSDNARKALAQEYSKPFAFNTLAEALGAEIVDDPKKANVDLSLNLLERDSFIKLFA